MFKRAFEQWNKICEITESTQTLHKRWKNQLLAFAICSMHLHLETRIGIKLLTTMLEDDSSQCASGNYPNVSEVASEKERITRFVSLIEKEKHYYSRRHSLTMPVSCSNWN